MCILMIVQSVRQSLQMYQVTKRWQLDRYMILLVKQGILYFFVCVTISSLSSPLPSKLAMSISPIELTVTFCHSVSLSALFNILYISGRFPMGGWQLYLLIILGYVPMFSLSHRFVISI